MQSQLASDPTVHMLFAVNPPLQELLALDPLSQLAPSTWDIADVSDMSCGFWYNILSSKGVLAGESDNPRPLL